MRGRNRDTTKNRTSSRMVTYWRGQNSWEWTSDDDCREKGRIA